MSAYTNYPNDSNALQHSFAPPRQNQFQQDDFKASYDDLIDENSAPYGTNARHQTYTVQTPSHPDHRRGPSYPLAPKSSYSIKQSNDTVTDISDIGGYPPPLPTKEVDTRGFWQKVCESLPWLIVALNLERFADIA